MTLLDPRMIQLRDRYMIQLRDRYMIQLRDRYIHHMASMGYTWNIDVYVQT